MSYDFRISFFLINFTESKITNFDNVLNQEGMYISNAIQEPGMKKSATGFILNGRTATTMM